MPAGCDVRLVAWSVGFARLWCGTCEKYISEWKNENYIRFDEVCEAVLGHLRSGFQFACGNPGCTCGACEK